MTKTTDSFKVNLMPISRVKFFVSILVLFLSIFVLGIGSKAMAASASPTIPTGTVKVGPDTPAEILKEKMSSISQAFKYYAARLRDCDPAKLNPQELAKCKRLSHVFNSDQAKAAKTAAQKLITDNQNKTCPGAESTKDKCVQDINQAKNSVKTDYRLAKYYEIMAGATNMCVKADLGLKPRLIGTPYKPNKAIGNFGRLYLCSEKDGNLTWRVLSDSKQGGSTMVRVVQIGEGKEAAGGGYTMTRVLESYEPVATLTKDDVKKFLLTNYVNEAEGKAGLKLTE